MVQVEIFEKVIQTVIPAEVGIYTTNVNTEFPFSTLPIFTRTGFAGTGMTKKEMDSIPRFSRG